MDLATSRRPQPIPGVRKDLRSLALTRPEVLPDPIRGVVHALDPLARELLAVLAETTSILPAELTRRIAAPRIAVQEAVAALTRGLVLDTPRAQRELALRADGAALCLLDEALEPVAAAALATAFHAALCELLGRLESAAVAIPARLDAVSALVRPAHAALEARAQAFRDSERFATRTAFGLPELTSPDQGERFLGRLGRAAAGLSASASAELMRLLGGEPEALGAATAAQLAALAATRDRVARLLTETGQASEDAPDLLDLAASATAHALLASAAEVLAALGRSGAREIFIHDLEVLLGRAAPRPLPAWLGR